MNRLFYFFALIFAAFALFSCTSEKNRDGEFSLDENLIKKERDERIALIKKSPIAQKQNFKSPKYFSSNEDFILPADLIRDKEPKSVKLINPETLTDCDALKIGAFNLYYNNDEYHLPVYGINDGSNKKKYLYVFFKDKTSGKESCSLGRYIKIEEEDADEDEYILDFNLAFNPLSVYINTTIQFRPPTETMLPIAIKCGEMNP